MAYIPVVNTGFYYSSSADRSANDRTIYVESDREGNYTLGARYKNAERSELYEIELNADDLIIFGQMLIDAGKAKLLIDARHEKNQDGSQLE